MYQHIMHWGLVFNVCVCVCVRACITAFGGLTSRVHSSTAGLRHDPNAGTHARRHDNSERQQ